LVSVCGPAWADSAVCCDYDQLDTLEQNMRRAETLLSNCPACRNNFHDFFCTMTCSPHQADFLNITEMQDSDSGKRAVKTLEYYTSEQYTTGFYNSCKDVTQFGSRVLDLIAPKAKSGPDFVRSLGQYKTGSQGSPFQINFPEETPSGKIPFDAVARNCADADLANRCTCVDCPDVCTTLPPVEAPGSQSSCHIGAMSCLTFVLTLGYALVVVGFLAGFFTSRTMRRRREKRFNDTSSVDTALETPLSPRIHTLVGASSLAGRDGEESLGTPSEALHLGRGASLLDPIETVQPRQYKLNNVLRRSFYRLGLFTASRPFLTFAIVFTLVGLLNLGWSRFEIETNPVRLWVSPDSESKLQSDYFDANFGPFYRVEQLFITSTNESKPVLSWDHLNYLAQVESDIRQLMSSTGVTLDDICFKPLGEDGPCVVQSPLAWFPEGIDGMNNTWSSEIVNCANRPADCLPEFLQPLEPKFVLGGIPGDATTGEQDYLGSRAMVITAVVTNSLDTTELERIEGWERAARDYMQTLTERAPKEAGLHFAFSTGVSLTEEINKSTNMDARIVILSYLAMFVYVALTLGNGGSAGSQDTVWGSLKRWTVGLPHLFRRNDSYLNGLDDTPTWFPRLPRSTFVNSKIILGLFSIGLVILSVSTSVAFFSALGVKVTLIIAEVIPFLVLAVGVDNIFILVHEVDRQNLLHGPNANPTAVMNSGTVPVPDTRDATFDTTGDDTATENAPAPSLLPVEERAARALARMGPSILLSTITEVLAFTLGALVPMPAVRNFALYAAGSVFLNALMQVTVFVSAMTLDLRRVEAGRMDIFPCIRLSRSIRLPEARTSGAGVGSMAKFIRRYYAPFLLRPVVKSCVLACFGGLFVASVISIQHINMGLGQCLLI
jgi:Niemann-Pick C1 protein